jgi:hypothetical protein
MLISLQNRDNGCVNTEELTLLSAIATFLSGHNVLTLAYADVTHQNGVGACALWFAVDEACTCYFLSTATTRHGAALAAGGSVSFTVQKDEQDWRAIQGVQGRGWCNLVAEEEQPRAWAIYTARFPFVAQQFPSLTAALTKTRLWQIKPTWLRLIDNTKGFAHKDEIIPNP